MSTEFFNDPQAVTDYAQRPPRLVPGFSDLQRMSMLLMAERAKPDAHILVLGAGGGLELELFAREQPRWRFDGIDPSAAMLHLAHQRLEPHLSRVQLLQGYIDDAAPGPFDAACSLLTLHFIERDERRRTLAQVHKRLRPGAPFVAAHFSFSRASLERERWLTRYVAFAVYSGVAPADANRASEAIRTQLPILSPAEDEAVLRDAGFTDIEVFYTGFGFRGWVASA
ncbi:class I SAM-dependent methyltransferase [Rhodoferax sp.]|uniref:class I SAM-dependent methyltransferase n=1 Tax=Rhodoferax sp. TaxID=50421 RepID=UPI00374DCBEF